MPNPHIDLSAGLVPKAPPSIPDGAQQPSAPSAIDLSAGLTPKQPQQAPGPFMRFLHSFSDATGVTPGSYARGLMFGGIDPEKTVDILSHPIDSAKQAYNYVTSIPGEVRKGAATLNDSSKPIDERALAGLDLAEKASPLPSTRQTVQSVQKGSTQAGSRDYAGAAGTTAGIAAPFVVPSLLEAGMGVKATPGETVRNNPIVNTVLGRSPESLTPEQAATKAIKPRNSIQNWDDHVARALPDIRRAADTMGMDPGTMSLQDAESAVSQAKKDVWGEFEGNHLGPGANIQLDTSSVADRINGTGRRMTAIQKRRNPGIVGDISDAAKDYDGQSMSIRDVEDRIQELNNELRSQQAQYKVNEMALRNDPRYAYKFAELDGLRQIESNAVDRLSKISNQQGPSAGDLKQRYGSLKVLQDALNRRIPVVERQSAAGLYETVGRVSGLGDLASGVIARDPARVISGAVKMYAGKNAAAMNNPDMLLQTAMQKTPPRPAATVSAQAQTGTQPSFIRGQLQAAPIVTPAPADTSGSVPYTPPSVDATTRAQRMGLMLPERTAIEVGPSNPPEAPMAQTPGKIVVRDPKTGQAKTFFTNAPQGEDVPPVQYQMAKPSFLQNMTQEVPSAAEQRLPQNSALRSALNDAFSKMTPEEQQATMFADEKSGLPNRKAFIIAKDALRDTHPHVGFADVDDFKSYNTTLGEPTVDQTVFPAIGDAMRKAVAAEGGKVHVFHVHGDEFNFLGSDPEAISRVVDRVNQELQNSVFEIQRPDGSTAQMKGVQFSHGTGPTEAAASAAEQANKQARKAAGLRAGSRTDENQVAGPQQSATGQPSPPNNQSGRQGIPGGVSDADEAHPVKKILTTRSRRGK